MKTLKTKLVKVLSKGAVATTLFAPVVSAIEWNTTEDTVANAIGLIGTIVSEIVNIIPDVMVLIIVLAIAGFVGAFLKVILGKISTT